MTREERSDAARRGWVTRRRNGARAVFGALGVLAELRDAGLVDAAGRPRAGYAELDERGRFVRVVDVTAVSPDDGAE